MGFFSRIGDWVDERAGHRWMVREFAEETIPGRSRWSYIFGSILVFLLIFQSLSGFLLSLSYAPSSESAHASLKHFMEETTLGWFIRSLHAHGASFIVILIVLHTLQVFLYGAYKRPRELNWVIGLLLGALMFAFAFTGYLLPWDQRAYWATKVGTNIMGTAPVAGPLVQNIVQGGPEIGNLTLTRFYSVHVILLPVLTIIGLTAHLYLFRRHGVTPPEGVTEKDPSETFWPAQALKDTVAGLLVVVGLFIVAWAKPMELGEPADPSVDYPARPEWYFLFLFQLLKYFEGPYEVLGTVVAPPVLAILMLAIPFVDRGPSRRWRDRKLALLLGLFLAGGWVALTGLAVYDDYQSGHYEELEIWEAEADPNFDVEAFYRENCFECHGRDGSGYLEATPDFTSEAYWSGVRSDVRLVKSILNGVTNEKIPEDERMPAFAELLSAAEAKAMVEFKIKEFQED